MRRTVGILSFVAIAGVAWTAIPRSAPTMEASFPLSFTKIYDASRSVIGGYPIDAEFGSNTTGLAQAVVGATQIPASVTAPNHSAGVAGYARTASRSHMAVGVHGFGGITGDGGQAEGAHFLTTNCGQQACPPSSGFNAADNFTIESDINIMKTAAGDPTGNAFGLIFFGASEAVPKGSFQAVRVDSPGVFQKPVIAWKEAFYTADGAAKTGLDLGATSEAHEPAGSQPIQLRGHSPDGLPQKSTIRASQTGDIDLEPSSGTLTVKGNAVRIALSSAPQSSHAPCEGGEIQWDKQYVYVCIAKDQWRRSELSDW